MVKPLGYNTGLSLKEARQRYMELVGEFERVKSHYSGRFGRLKKLMSKDDKKTLTQCIEVALPLNHEKSVQREVIETGQKEDVLFYKIACLEEEIIKYESRFWNTGIKPLTPSRPIRW